MTSVIRILSLAREPSADDFEQLADNFASEMPEDSEWSAYCSSWEASTSALESLQEEFGLSVGHLDQIQASIRDGAKVIVSIRLVPSSEDNGTGLCAFDELDD